MKNSMCDGENCLSSTGQVRLLPTGGGGNAILCKSCFNHEMNYRKELNQGRKIFNEFDIVKWKELKIYN